MSSTIFLSNASEDHDYAEQVRQGLAASSYTVWHEPDYPTPRDQSYPYMIENAILGSAAVIVLWSHSAATTTWVKRHILIAQRFFKPLIPVRLDETSLPSTLLSESLSGEQSASDLVVQLLSRLPAADQNDPLLTLGQQASHEYIRVRKEAIDQAAAMLQRGEHRQEVLAILEYIARNDLMSGVREKAEGVLSLAAQPNTVQQPATLAQSQDARHFFSVRCQNGHVTTFDRRKVCAQRKEIMRGLDELILTCATCGSEMGVNVDCEGY